MTVEIIGVAKGSPLAAISSIRTFNQGKIDERDVVNYYFEHKSFKNGCAYKITIQELADEPITPKLL